MTPARRPDAERHRSVSSITDLVSAGIGIRFDPSTIGRSSVAVHATRPFRTTRRLLQNRTGHQTHPSPEVNQKTIVSGIPFHFMRHFPTKGELTATEYLVRNVRLGPNDRLAMLIDTCATGLHRLSLSLLFPHCGAQTTTVLEDPCPAFSSGCVRRPISCFLAQHAIRICCRGEAGQGVGRATLVSQRRAMPIGAWRPARWRAGQPSSAMSHSWTDWCGVRRSGVGNLRGIWGSWGDGEGGGCGRRGPGLFSSLEKMRDALVAAWVHLSGRAHSGSSNGLAWAGWAAKEGVMCRTCNQQQGGQCSA